MLFGGDSSVNGQRAIVNLGSLVARIQRFVRQDSGNAVTEYAVMLALIVLASIVAIAALGVAVSELLPDLGDYISLA